MIGVSNVVVSLVMFASAFTCTSPPALNRTRPGALTLPEPVTWMLPPDSCETAMLPPVSCAVVQPAPTPALNWTSP
jgi:hypothetical protein